MQPLRQGWFPCACCPPNLARTYAGLGQYLLSQNEGRIYLQQYIGFETTIAGTKLKLSGDYAGEGKMRLAVNSEQGTKLALRQPGWCSEKITDAETSENGWLFLDLPAGEHEIELDFKLKAEFLLARPEVRHDRGLVALRRGPLIYAVEEADNGANLAALLVVPEQEISLEQTEPYPTLQVKGFREEAHAWPTDQLYQPFRNSQLRLQPVTIRYVPYAFWGNRGNGKSPEQPGEMRVWLRFTQTKQLER